MARPSSASRSARGGSGVWKYVGAAAVAIVGGVGIGYLFGGARGVRAPEQPVPSSATVLTPSTTPGVSPASIRPQTTNGNYTAPNAPRITIREEQTPILRRVTPPTPPPVDSEASQEAGPTPRTPRRTTTDTAPSDSTTPAPLDSNPSTTPPTVNTGPAAPDPGKAATPDSSRPSTRPAPKPPANADPDIEQVTPRGTPAPPPDTATHAQFRVQTGAYADEGNARTVADQLRGQGYSTSTRSERDGDHLVYKVQVGAYRSKSGAAKAADDLQKKGVPVYVTPIGP